jgi:recombination protein RecA
MKENDFKIKLAIKDLRKKYGNDSIFFIGEEKEKSMIKRWSTGFNDFDNMLEGGMPCSRVIEISGTEGAGKTSLCVAMSSKVDFTALIDAEGTLDEDRVVTLGADPKKMLIVRPETGEEICDEVVTFVKAEIPLIIIDSVPSIVPHDFLDKVSKTNFEANNIAGTARLLSQKLFPTLIPALKNSRSTIIFINQIRDKIGMIFGDPTDTPGGRALKHYAALRIQVRRKGWYGKLGERFGQLCSFRVIKSKVSHPYKECEIPLLFDKGFVSHEEIKLIIKKMKRNKNDNIT